MAHNYSLWLGCIVVLFLCMAPCAYCSSAPNVTEICAMHNNPVFCEEILKKKQGSDFLTLAEYVIEQVQIRIGSTKVALDKMVQTKEVRLAQHYESCRKSYDEAMEGIKMTKERLDDEDYYGMNVAATAVMTDIDDCASSEAPGFDPSVFLVKTNQDLENLCVIVMIMANLASAKN